MSDDETPEPTEPHLAECQLPTCTATEVHGHNDGGWMLRPRPGAAEGR